MRDHGGTTLDEVDRITEETGVRVTRSHLSRVENGDAELSISRFLALMGVFGRPVGPAAEQLYGVQAGARGQEPAGEIARRARRWMQDGDPASACRRLRGALAGRGADVEPGLAWLWILAEARLGRFAAAFDAAVLRVEGSHPHPGLLAAASVAALASGRQGLARALAALLAEARPEAGVALQAAGALAEGDFRRGLAHLEQVAGPGDSSTRTIDTPVERACRLLRVEAYRQGRHLRSAQRLLAPGPRRKADELELVEDLRAEFRIERDRGRSGRAVALLDRALPKARRLGIPALLSRVQRERAEVLEARGARQDAAAARRAAEAIARRSGADASVCGSFLPLQLLIGLIDVPLPE
jgi:transcriptional regulator with XRE-family HTH domain